ncbi:hemolysin [Paracoccus sp. DK608]|uniref:Hemolysin n=2 Tax=Paracoccus shanxieyensis TaxID=2675752 RepID=A0A6L6IU18_9RHOB|nr:hemolysin [Paracoccus shanxieyensis]MTH86836.1 hemolysin [Paracoccus shanxieyensis]
MVTDTPFNQQNIEITATITPAFGSPITVTAPISGIANAITAAVPALQPVVTTILTPAVNGLVNTAALTIQPNTGATKTIPPAQLLCFVTGTLIETDRGMIAVQDLKAGDLVVTRDNGLQPIRWIGSVKMGKGALMAQPKLRPIRIKAGALGNDMPTADLLVSPQHRVLVRSKVAMKMFGALEVLVAAKQLLQIDGIDIAHDVAEAEYFHFLFDRHEVVNSNGAATESLFTGPEALKAVDREARQEIFSLFPQLRSDDFVATPARPIPAGRRSRKLAVRHAQRPGALVS